MAEILSGTKYSKSAKAVLLAAKDLFWKYGIYRVTVEEICEEASISKMTFYRSFENKYHVADIILKDITSKSYTEMTDLFCSNIPFPQKINQFLSLKKEMARKVSIEFIKDLYAENEFTNSMKKYFEISQAKLMLIVKRSFVEAKRDGWIRDDMKIEFILYMFESIGTLSKDEKLLSLFDNSEELTSVIVNFMFRGILSDKKVV